jgi:succinate dehydrogenase/fumarate reductase flavoprotein subunit
VLNVHGEQFVYEREPRDVEAACIIRECSPGGRGNGVPTPTGKFGVWLDSPMIDMLKGEGTVRKEFPGKHILFRRFNIDISKEPMLIHPTLHYQNGGLDINSKCETNVPGLFAAGEVAGGIHGENRLMGNSLLDVIVFGRIAGENAVEYMNEHPESGQPTLDHVKRYNEELKKAGIKEDRIAPMILPDYSNPEVRKKQLTKDYFGTLS